MMTYENLRHIAKPHIRKTDNLPSNSLLLLTQLHVPYRTEKQCREDFKGKYNPLDTYPAFLYIDEEKNKTMYFNTATKYYNFYIFHEIAHHLLGHEDDSPQNELDADMLACILTAPVENLPSNIKSARDISTICQIPIDKAEMYWSEIRKEFSNTYKKIILVGCILLTLVVSIFILSFFKNDSRPITPLREEDNAQNQKVEQITKSMINPSDNLFYHTSSGTHYHKKDCQYVKYKTNIISISQEDAYTLSLIPCEECIE